MGILLLLIVGLICFPGYLPEIASVATLAALSSFALNRLFAGNIGTLIDSNRKTKACTNNRSISRGVS